MLCPFVPVLNRQICCCYHCGIGNSSSNHASRGGKKVPRYSTKPIHHHVIDETGSSENGSDIERQHGKMPHADGNQQQFRSRLGEIGGQEAVVKLGGSVPEENPPNLVAYTLPSFCSRPAKQIQYFFPLLKELPLPRQRPPPEDCFAPPFIQNLPSTPQLVKAIPNNVTQCLTLLDFVICFKGAKRSTDRSSKGGGHD